MSTARKIKSDEGLPIPEMALAAHIACLGKTGSGKTSTAKSIIENRVAEGYRVCILDPIKSDWWGITSSADGKRPGLPFTILGGPRGHAPLPPRSGKMLAELVASGKLPLSVIDMADFGMGDHQKFFTEFAETLFKRIKGVVYLVLEEAHLFAPKEQSGVAGESLAIYWAKMLATGGRSKGIRMIVATQRTQALHNAVLGSCETALVHRFTLPADQKPVRDWLKGNVEDAALVKKIDSGMSSIATGSCWMCAGEAKVFKFVAWPRITTFDNSATPTKDGSGPNVKTAAVDLEALKAMIGDAAAEVAANDPKALRQQVAKLQRELAAAQKHPAAAPPAKAAALPTQQIEQIKAEAHRAGYLEGARSREPEIQEAFSAGADAMLAQLQGAATVARGKLRPPRPAAIALPPPMRNVTPPPAAKPAPAPKPAPARAVAPPVGDAADLGPKGAVLAALAWWAAAGHHSPSRKQVAAIVGVDPTGSTLRAYLAALNAAELIRYNPDKSLSLTDAGAAIAPAHEEKPLHDFIKAQLNEAQRRVFDLIVEAGGAIDRDDLANGMGVDARGSTLRAYLAALSKLELIEYQGATIALQDWVQGG